MDSPAEPSFAVVQPQPGARIAEGKQLVHGVAISLQEVMVNGQPATITPGVWRAELPMGPGIEMVDVQATSRDGDVYQDRFAVLAGTLSKPPVAGAEALSVHVDQAGFAELGPLATSLLDPSTLLGDIGGDAPIFEDSEMAVYVAGVEIPSLDLDITPRQGFLDVTMDMPGLTILLDVVTKLWWFIEIEVNANLRISQAALTGELVLGSDGNGGLEMSFDDVAIHAQGVEIDIDGLADFFEDMFITDEEVEDLLDDNLATLEDSIPDLLDDALGSLGELSFDFDLLETALSLDLAFSEVSVAPSGLALGLDLQVSADGVSSGESLTVGVPEPGDGLAIQLSDDALNHALDVVWAAGGLDLVLPLEPGSLDAMLLAVFGGEPSAGGALALQAALPPVVVGRDGGMRLQLGECLLTVDTPGGAYGEQVQVMMAADMAFGLEITDEMIGAKLSDATVQLVAVGDNAEAVAPHIADMEATMAAGIGLLNGLLSFPLDDLGLGGTTTTGTGTSSGTSSGTAPETEEGILGGLTLPPFELQRDPSDRATWIALDLEGWTL